MEALPYIIIRGQTGRLHGASPAAGAKKSAEKTPLADRYGAGGREGLSPPAASPSVTKRFRFLRKNYNPVTYYVNRRPEIRRSRTYVRLRRTHFSCVTYGVG